MATKKTEGEATSTDAPTTDAIPSTTTKLTLDRTYIHSGNTYGPGEVDVPNAIVSDLQAATERAKKYDANINATKEAIDARENERRAADARTDTK